MSDESAFNPSIEGRYEIRDFADQTILLDTARTKREADETAKRFVQREKTKVLVRDTMGRKFGANIEWTVRWDEVDGVRSTI